MTDIRKAFNDAIAMPILLALSLLGLILFFGYELLPAFLEIIDEDELPVFQAVVVDVTMGLSHNPLLPFLIIGAIIACLVVLMRYWTGPGRVRAKVAILNGILLVLVAFTLVVLMSVMMPVFDQLKTGNTL